MTTAWSLLIDSRDEIIRLANKEEGLEMFTMLANAERYDDLIERLSREPLKTVIG